MRTCSALLLALLAATASAQEEARLLRFPTIHDTNIVFSYAGNLYTSSTADQSIARRLTNHDGYEMFARFSPDGKWLAFTGQYDGNTEVYLMPAEGGNPKRLTFTATLSRDEVSDRMGPNNIVMGWKGNSEIVFRSRMRDPNDFIGQLFTVNVSGGLPKQIPLPRGGFNSFSPDGKKLAYNRVFREFRTWKRYRGGMADDIWIHDFETKTTESISPDDACDVFPMWANEKIYFLSDRDANKRFNLYSYDLAAKVTKAHTDFADYDIKYPSLGNNAIVFEHAGALVRFDLKSQQTTKLRLRIRDDQLGGRPIVKDVSKSIGAYEISPDGKRALFSARGDLFTVPAKEGPTRNLTSTSGVHERNPKWSPDGKTIAFISDASGEDEIHLTGPEGGSVTQLTQGGPPYKYAIYWSPDSKKILWADKKTRLHFIDVASKKVTQVADSKVWEIKDYVWSPDSKWIAYAKSEESAMQKVFLYSVEQDKSFAVTDGWYESYGPAFSGDGKYLFFVSERDFSPTFSETEWNHAYGDLAKIYFVTLAKATKSPFAPKSDEANVAAPETPKATEKPATTVDVAGIQDRVLQLPITAANYRHLASVGSTVYYLRTSRKGGGSGFYMYDLAARKESVLGQINGYEISADGKKMLVSKDTLYGIIDLPKSTVSVDTALHLANMEMKLDRRKEWQQIFHESWRQMRDFFYDPGMHGNDWKALRSKYEVLLPHVNHRADLSYIIGEMISELNVGHAYVGGGDLPKPTRIQTGLLGAELEQDPKTKYYKIVKILKGVTWDKGLRSPLAEIGVDVNVGDYILAVDGQPTNEMVNIYESLVGTVGKQVRLKINKEPQLGGSREVVVVPIADEQPLYYYERVQRNIQLVADKTKGEVGYLHVPDMLSTGLNEFVKHYYPQLKKKALIIDVRGNGGGNVSPQIIERLRREIAMVGMSRDTFPRPNPTETFLGPMICVMNEFSASDGDIFPYRFRHYKLGKLVGKRSWGGTVGIRGTLPFVDGGSLNKPEFASYELNGTKWAIEGHGVDPDIVIDNDPALEFAGRDQQLERAIEVILEDIRTRGRVLPPIPAFPKK